MIKQILRNFRSYFFKGNPGLKEFKLYALNHNNQLQVDGFFNKYEGKNLEIYFEQINDKLGSITRKNDVVLEIGCGTGRYLKYLESKFKTDVKLYGIDITEETIYNITKKNVSSAVTLLAGDFIEHNSIKDERFTVVYSISVLQYIPFFKVNAFFNKIHKILKKEGTGYLIFAPKKNKHPNFLNSVLDLSFTTYDPKLIVNKIEKKFKVMEHQYIYVDGAVFGYYVLFKK